MSIAADEQRHGERHGGRVASSGGEQEPGRRRRERLGHVRQRADAGEVAAIPVTIAAASSTAARTFSARHAGSSDQRGRRDGEQSDAGGDEDGDVAVAEVRQRRRDEEVGESPAIERR